MGGTQKKSHCCPYEGCNSSFYRPYRLELHLLVHNNVKAFVCPSENCTKSYTSKSHLDRHIDSVHLEIEKDIIYSCPICYQSYANRQNLKRHIKSKHEAITKEKQQFACYTCNLQFRKQHQLKTHMYRHTGVKAFSCEVCSKEFVSLPEKKSHSRAHKTYGCTQCTAIFNLWSKYQEHVKAEHREFICHHCDRKFKKRNHIVSHVKIHDSSRVFPCPYKNCKRFYSRNSNLRQHIVIKHKKMKHPCSICEAKLSTKARLDKHILKLHSSNVNKNKTPKTKATGRKLRKDLGVPKVSMALKLAGLVEEPEDECGNPSQELIDSITV